MRTDQTNHPARGIGRAAVNLTGILSAFAIALGGLLLVQSRLKLEQERLLEGGGLVELPQTGTSDPAGSVEVPPYGFLPEDDLLQVVHSLVQKEEIKPHEPLEGQLTMLQAIDCGKNWLEEFFLPYFTSCDLSANEYWIDCYLWTPETAGADPETSPWLSCWTVSLSSQKIDASLTLSAVSGQILDASISCSVPFSLQDRTDLPTLLEGYAASLGLETDDSLISIEDKDCGDNEALYFQSIGSRGIYAAIKTKNLFYSFTDTNTDTPVYMDRFSIRLYLYPEPVIQPAAP